MSSQYDILSMLKIEQHHMDLKFEKLKSGVLYCNLIVIFLSKIWKLKYNILANKPLRKEGTHFVLNELLD